LRRCDRELRRPDLRRIVLDPTRLREVLRQLTLVEANDTTIRVKDDRRDDVVP